MIYQNPNTTTESPWGNIALYAAFALWIVTLFSLSIFLLKAHLETRKISAWNERAAQVGALPGQTAAEQEIKNYQKMLADYKTISSRHKITSRIFSFIEERTLPEVWFSTFDMTQSSQLLVLKGETETMATLGRQTKVFEDSQKYVAGASVVESNVDKESGKVKFTLHLALHPAMFDYHQP